MGGVEVKAPRASSINAIDAITVWSVAVTLKRTPVLETLSSAEEGLMVNLRNEAKLAGVGTRSMRESSIAQAPNIGPRHGFVPDLRGRLPRSLGCDRAQRGIGTASSLFEWPAWSASRSASLYLRQITN